jgi:Response regulator containing CheY-like receiver domain and AraC-type DNA-binding domain
MSYGNAMVVEDQYHFRKGLVKMIEESEHKWNVVSEASNGRDALKMLEVHKPDLVLTDIRMPAMDGIEFVTQMRRMHPDTIVVILTGFKHFEYAQAAVKLGVMDFLVKPCTEEDVRDMLGRASEKFEAMRLPEPQTAEARPEDKQDNVIRKAIAYVEKHYADDCRMTEVASHVHLNPSYFSVLFKRVTGESFTAYVTRFRMEKAMELLRTTDMKVFEIASATGFGEPNYFTNVFRQHFRLSPKECRRRLAK